MAFEHLAIELRLEATRETPRVCAYSPGVGLLREVMNSPMIWDAFLHIKRSRRERGDSGYRFLVVSGEVLAAGVSAGAGRDCNSC
jgi:hypothetical protein